MLKTLFIATIMASTSLLAAAQTDLQKMVDTEHAFAKMAGEQGNKPAFLAYLTDDAWSFVPDKANAKKFWTDHALSPNVLVWAPNFADMAADGTFGYTTGNWDFRAGGKQNAPSAWGDFTTIWLKQPDGGFKWIVDLGIGHEQPSKYSTDWTTSSFHNAAKIKPPAPDVSMASFDAAMAAKGPSSAYSAVAADDIRLYREDKMPFLGKGAALKQAESEQGRVTFDAPMATRTSRDLAFTLRAYKRTKPDNTVEKGNCMQVWKYQNGHWKIVLDIFSALPAS